MGRELHRGAAVSAEDERAIELSSIAAIYPELVKDPDNFYVTSIKIPVEPIESLALALSGLPTPHSIVIDTRLQPDQLHDIELVEVEVARMMKPILENPIPFVVKMPQALSGQGTFMVRSEADRQTTLETLAAETKRMLLDLNDSNAHLKPCSLILQDMVIGDRISPSFFITATGHMVFICCTEQIMDSTGHWGGAFISYKQQYEYHRVYASILQRIAHWVYGKGYYGPINADVMVDTNGRQLVVDFNVRVAGSHPLGLLQTHFSS